VAVLETIQIYAITQSADGLERRLFRAAGYGHASGVAETPRNCPPNESCKAGVTAGPCRQVANKVATPISTTNAALE